MNTKLAKIVGIDGTIISPAIEIKNEPVDILLNVLLSGNFQTPEQIREAINSKFDITLKPENSNV